MGHATGDEKLGGENRQARMYTGQMGRNGDSGKNNKLFQQVHISAFGAAFEPVSRRSIFTVADAPGLTHGADIGRSRNQNQK